MTKSEFLEWLSDYAHVEDVRLLVIRHNYTDAELAWLKKSLEPSIRLLKSKEQKRAKGWG